MSIFNLSFFIFEIFFSSSWLILFLFSIKNFFKSYSSYIIALLEWYYNNIISFFDNNIYWLILFLIFFISFYHKNYSSEFIFWLIYFYIILKSQYLYLFGVLILYGLYGTTNLFLLHLILLNSNFSVLFNLLSVIGIIFIFISIFFKLGLVPFHWWILDVYQGSSLVIVTFFYFYWVIVNILFILCV